jgi:hypothetical protein
MDGMFLYIWFMILKVSLLLFLRSHPSTVNHDYASTPCAFSVWASSTTALTDAISTISSISQGGSSKQKAGMVGRRRAWVTKEEEEGRSKRRERRRRRKKKKKGLTERRTQFNTSQCFNWFIFFNSPYDLVVSFWEVHILYIS